MKIGLWNIDHPEYVRRGSRRQRFEAVTKYLNEQQCDVYILTESNAAIQLPGYHSLLSAESPFYNQKRCYEPPNQYHQVGIYSRLPLSPIAVDEPVNGVLCTVVWHEQPLFIYGNVITIKDQWAKQSDKKYKDRLSEQLTELGRLARKRVIVGGDFNCRRGLRGNAHKSVKELTQQQGWKWPTECEADTVQHVVHAAEFQAGIGLDNSVQHNWQQRGRLSDHPFIAIEVCEV